MFQSSNNDERYCYCVDYDYYAVVYNNSPANECICTDEPAPMIFKCENQVQRVELVEVSSYHSDKNFPGIVELQLGLCDWSSRPDATTPDPERTTTENQS